MNGPELWIAGGLVLLAGLAALLVFWRRDKTPPPGIDATLKPLRRGLYQADIKITNRGTRAVGGVSLRRVRPRGVRLMSPIKQVTTKEGDFQVWADPEGDRPLASIPVDLVLGPWQPEDGVVSLSAEGHIAAWLFVPEAGDLQRLLLELSLRDERGRVRRTRFGITPA